MKAAGLKQIKDEMQALSTSELQDLCLRLIKFKKESKELATYMIFYKNEEEEFVADIKNTLSEQFENINISTAYFAKKGLRKYLRLAGRYERYTQVDSSSLEIYLHVATELQHLATSLKKNTQVKNMFTSVSKKIASIYTTLHPDLQFDYKQRIAAIEHF